MTWIQDYVPVVNVYVSALIAAVPVIILLGLLAFAHAPAHWAALAGLAAAVVIAILVYGMPVRLAGAAVGYGAAFGLFPIGWIVLSAIFLYDVTVHTGQFEVVKQTIAGLAGDRRIQALLIAFAFGAFVEGAAGFGTPVAISAAMLIGLGFRPLAAAGLTLIGNTAPVAFGALGTPLITLAAVTGLPLDQLSAMVGRQLPFFSLLVPFWLVWAMAGLRGMAGVWPACLVAGLSFGITQFFVSNYIGPQLVDIIGALVCILSLVALLKLWTIGSRMGMGPRRNAEGREGKGERPVLTFALRVVPEKKDTDKGTARILPSAQRPRRPPLPPGEPAVPPPPLSRGRAAPGAAAGAGAAAVAAAAALRGIRSA